MNYSLVIKVNLSIDMHHTPLKH